MILLSRLQDSNGLGGEVDPARIILWGSSYSGGHSLAAASMLGKEISAVCVFVYSYMCNCVCVCACVCMCVYVCVSCVRCCECLCASDTASDLFIHFYLLAPWYFQNQSAHT